MLKASLLVLGIGSVLLAGWDQSARQELSVARHYEGVEGAKFDGLGVCSISPDSIDCWDMDGNRSEKLSADIRQQLAAGTAPDVPFRPQLKNRYLVLMASRHGSRLMGYQARRSIFLPGDKEPSLMIVPTVCETDQREVAFDLGIDDMVHSPAATLAFSEGARSTVSGVRLELGPQREELRVVPNWPFFPWVPNARSWSIIVGAQTLRDKPLLAFQAIGRDGKPIEYVDRDGGPVAEADYLKWFVPFQTRKVFTGNDYKYSEASFDSRWPSTPGASTVVFNVNPKWIKSLRIMIVTRRHVTITGFPADPNPSSRN